jgi:endonuclease/exonuclease/phosphatase family metal-dependent hydrolase
MLIHSTMRVCRQIRLVEATRVYRAIVRAAAVLGVVLGGALPAAANTYVMVDSPKANATVASSFVVGGWALDDASRTGSGISHLHIWAYPATGAAAVFLGEIPEGGARPDVAAHFGPQFGQSGFSVLAKGLASGKYTLVVFPYNSIRKAFDYQSAAAVPINVAAATKSYVVVDSPRANATVPASFAVAGWALDLAATYDSGISQLHVWAYPATGAAPVFVGEATRGPRPDVAASFGPQFAQAGFSITVTGLAAGRHTLVISPFNSIRNGFDHNAAIALPVDVAPVSGPTPTPSGKELRVLQWNIHHGGFGTDNIYSPDRVATWVATMNPDVVMFNEIEKYTSWGNQDQPEVYKNLLQQKTGRTWYYVFAQEFGEWSSNGKGNIIYSTYPINVSDRYELMRNGDRSIAMASITVNGQPITLINTHLDPYDPSLRLAQATEVTTWSAVQPENRILTGDMNAWPNQTSIAQFNTTYHDSWTVAASQGTATAFPGNDGQTKNGRIDYIFYSKSSRNLSVKSSQVYDTRDANGAMPSDHRPVLTTFIVK